jgi:hypothetical protein
MFSLPLNQKQRNNEWLHIQHVAQNNGIPLNLLLRLRRTIQHNTLHNTNYPSPHPLPKKKWATFTYTSPQIRKITNLFKHTDVNISFKGYNTMAQLLKPDRNTHQTGTHTPPLPSRKVASTRFPA